ncbi:DUF4013 domain-containing protein [Halocatena pleomorpha]|uniref:DUF4013 domain-containing protein n=1 Tax=Halocatena pleomorpha TaxID=1785090 RepID=A0A3P3R4Y8_9EURY|nr:DUF4013 domain-containing protein [Halocatena pleomorpha]RRJ28415.1 DUF4013 domain-containing protein [Halocatena pleomorpha]
MLREALTYPLQSDHRLKTIGIGGALQFSAGIILTVGALFSVGVFVLVALISLSLTAVFWGYYLRVLRTTATEKTTLPVFDDWKELGVNGVKFFAITIGYLSVPIVLIFTEVIFLTGDGGTMTETGATVYIVARLLTFVIVFFVPVGWTNYALTNQLREAFAVRDIVGAALTRSYVKTVLLSLPLWFCYRLIQLFQAFVSGPGAYILYLAIASVVSFYLLIVIFSLLGRGCGPHLREVEGEEVSD